MINTGRKLQQYLSINLMARVRVRMAHRIGNIVRASATIDGRETFIKFDVTSNAFELYA